MRRFERLLLAALVTGAGTAGNAFAQGPPLKLPDPSPAASVSQTVGVTEITISYHRPGVHKRKIWGELVPYDEVWRAGANENTTIAFSTPATVGGKTLPAGTYGLHTLPGKKDWSVMLSSVSSAWGSFSYDAKEDVARFTVTPKTVPDFEERLEYRFEDPTENSVNVVLQWEKLQLSFPVTVDTKALTLASLKSQLRGLSRFGWQGWNQAAQWCLRNDVDREQALAWADQSIGVSATFQNLRTKAAILEAKGDSKTANELRERALKLATESDLNLYGYQLLGEKKQDEAIAIFRKNVQDHPDSWNTYDSLGEALAATGDKRGALENYNKALALTTDPAQKKRIHDIVEKLEKASGS